MTNIKKRELLESMIKHVETKRENMRTFFELGLNYDLDMSEDAFISQSNRESELINPSKQIQDLNNVLSHLYNINLKSDDERDSLLFYEIEPRFQGKYNYFVVSPTFPSFSKTIGNDSFYTLTYKSNLGEKLLDSDVGDVLDIADKDYSILSKF